jgi:hypothetical protein
MNRATRFRRPRNVEAEPDLELILRVVGTDEAFFEDEKEKKKLLDLYHEKAGILDDDDDRKLIWPRTLTRCGRTPLTGIPASNGAFLICLQWFFRPGSMSLRPESPRECSFMSARRKATMLWHESMRKERALPNRSSKSCALPNARPTRRHCRARTNMIPSSGRLSKRSLRTKKQLAAN